MRTWIFRKDRRSVLYGSVSLLLIISTGIGSIFYISTRDTSRSEACRHNLKQIGLALKNYLDSHGTFPPAYLCDETGKLVNSWRTEVIPSFWYNFRSSRGDCAGEKGYDFSQPWNGPNNADFRLEKKRCFEFQCPDDSPQAPAITNYVAVIGPDTMWQGTAGIKPAADGSDNDKILVIEVIDSDILWMEPRDMTLEQALNSVHSAKGIRIGSHHSDGIHYLTVGGAVRTLDPSIDRESLRKLLVRNSTVAACR